MAYILGMTHRQTPKKQAPVPAGANAATYRESRFYVLRGFLMLLAGSALLLTCKLPLPGFMMEACALLGGIIILLGNGYILFGLLIYADSRTT